MMNQPQRPTGASKANYDALTNPLKNMREQMRSQFREKCLAKKKEMRLQFTHDRRSVNSGNNNNTHDDKMLEDFVKDQWNQFSKEENLNTVLSGDDYIDLMNYLEQTIRQELIQEAEQRMLEDYHKNEEEALKAHLQQTNEALCPVCKKNKLLQNKHVIFCACGLRIDTQNDGITLGFVHQVLVDTLNEHSSRCAKEPHFQVINDPIPALYMMCDDCNTFQVIL